MTRSLLLVAALFAAVLSPLSAVAEPLSTEEALKERVIGDPNAPITIIEYASLTCPHCATLHAETLPKLKKEWLDTGKAKLIYRDFPLDQAAAAAAMIARCAPADRYFVFLNAFYSQQKNWAKSPDPIAVLTQLAALGGMPKQDVEACLANEALQDGILQMRLDGQLEYEVNSTPTLIINDKKVTNLPYDDLNDLLEDAE